MTRKPLVSKILKSEFHRNGVCGAGFVVSIFEDDEGRTMLGVRFDAPGHCAVFDLAKLAEHNIAFGQNSFRGDHFEAMLPSPDGQVFSPIPASAIEDTMKKVTCKRK